MKESRSESLETTGIDEAIQEETKLEDKSGLSSPVSRRRFLGRAGATGTVLAASVTSLPALLGPETARADDDLSTCGETRRNEAYQVRLKTARAEYNVPLPPHPTNGDEQRYPTKIGNYSKALPHNGLGVVELPAYDILLDALRTGKPAEFAAIPLGGTTKLQNPQASYAYLLEGVDSHATGMIVPPAFASDEQGGEMDEDYWLALTRDVPFSQYGSEPFTEAAIKDLNRFPNYAGVNAGSLFRAPEIAGTLIGPYLSQLFWLNVPYGATKIVQQYKVPLPGTSNDFNTVYSEWLDCENGVKPTATIDYDPQVRYIRNGRDVGEWVHKDWPYMGGLDALLIILGLTVPPNEGNPYDKSTNQAGFVTFGTPYYTDLVARVCVDSMKAAWFQKWLVHRRVRPEAFGGSVHNTLIGAADYPISKLLLNSQAVKQVFSTYGSYLLPMAYPEGCPTHPSYPAAHAVVAGACATVLKALFDEAFVFPDPVVASDDGLSLVPYSGATLTLGNELNKLASNIAIARDAAAVHWHSDGVQGMLLGEAVAISVLKDYRATYHEPFTGFTFTKFNGTTITV